SPVPSGVEASSDGSGLCASRSWSLVQPKRLAAAMADAMRAATEVMRGDLWYQRRMAKARVVGVTGGAAGALRRGHPWVWRAGVARAADGLSTGDVVELRGTEGEPLGQGIWDATSPIAARIYTRDTASMLDASLIASAIERAILRRAAIALGT